jgi:uncharacterized protein (TIGR00730 family)
MTEKIVSVFGSGRAREGDESYTLAEQVGRALAEGGYAVANGGYGGTMLASSKGAAAVNGAVIGVTCSAFKNSVPNAFITREIVTASLDERLKTLVEIGQAYVVLPGGTGTLLELATVWELKNKGFLDSRRPIILLGRFWKPLVELVCQDDRRSAERVRVVERPEAVVGCIREAI